jgi:anti-sigma regulatory factor (Ser/Thr protein kinase)
MTPATVTRVLPGRPESARAAREFTAGCLAGCPAAADAVVCVSELVANAVLHSRSGLPGGMVTVRITVAAGEWLRVEVEDAGPLAAVPAPRGALDEGGRGLMLVVGLADVFGADAAKGKRWFGMPWDASLPTPLAPAWMLADLLDSPAGAR